METLLYQQKTAALITEDEAKPFLLFKKGKGSVISAKAVGCALIIGKIPSVQKFSGTFDKHLYSVPREAAERYRVFRCACAQEEIVAVLIADTIVKIRCDSPV